MTFVFLLNPSFFAVVPMGSLLPPLSIHPANSRVLGPPSSCPRIDFIPVMSLSVWFSMPWFFLSPLAMKLDHPLPAPSGNPPRPSSRSGSRDYSIGLMLTSVTRILPPSLEGPVPFSCSHLRFLCLLACSTPVSCDGRHFSFCSRASTHFLPRCPCAPSARMSGCCSAPIPVLGGLSGRLQPLIPTFRARSLFYLYVHWFPTSFSTSLCWTISCLACDFFSLDVRSSVAPFPSSFFQPVMWVLLWHVPSPLPPLSLLVLRLWEVPLYGRLSPFGYLVGFFFL